MSLTLRTLGPLELDGAPLDQAESVLRAPKRVALLAYLATAAPNGFVRRDSLLALLWPDSDTEQARRSLRNLVHHIRRALGEDVILARGAEEVGVNPERLTSDAARFEAAVESGDGVTALELYRGHFLGGFFAPGAAHEFQEWIDARRRRLADKYREVLEHLAADAEERKDVGAAVDLWRRAAEHDRLSSRIALRYMKALHAAGDTARAIRHAEVHAAILAQELGSKPDSDVLDFADQLRSGDHRAGSDAAPIFQRGSPYNESESTTGPPLPHSVRQSGWKRAAGISIVVALVLAGITMAARRSAGIAFRARDFILLADIQNHSGDSTLDAPATTALSLGLRQSRFVNIFPRDRVRSALIRMGRDSVATLPIDLAREVALRETAVRAILSAEITRVDTSYRFTGSIIEPSSGREAIVVTTRAQGTAEILPALDSLARGIRHALGESIDSIAASGASLPYATTSSLNALRLFAGGQRAWDEGRWQAARTMWEEAVTEDSTFAWAHASLGLADAWLGGFAPGTGDEHFARAETLLDRVTVRERLWIRALIARSRRNEREAARVLDTYVQLYPDDRDGWYNLGRHRWNIADYAGAIDAFERAIGLDPRMTNAYVNLGFLYDRQEDYASALAAFERATELQPEIRIRQQGGINHRIGFLYVKAGDSAAAAETFGAMLEGDPLQRADGHRSLGLLDMYYGRYRSAVEHLREATLLSQSTEQLTSEFRNRLYLVAAFRLLGRTEERDRELAVLLDLAREYADVQDFWLQRLGIELLHAGRVADSQALLDAMAPLSTDRASVPRRLLLGEILVAEGRTVAGLEHLELAYRLDPVAHVGARLAAAAYASGDADRAVELYGEVASDLSAIGYEAQEDWILASLHLARIAESRGDTSAAVDHYGRLLQQWEHGDADLLPIAEARDRVATLEGSRR